MKNLAEKKLLQAREEHYFIEYYLQRENERGGNDTGIDR